MCPVEDRQRGFCNGTARGTAAAGRSSSLEGGVTSPARLALSGKLMGYAGLGTVNEAMCEGIRRQFKGCPIYETMMNANGQLDGAGRCMEL